MAFIDLSSELSGELPGLPPNLADTYISRALERIYAARPWSFLGTDGYVVCPAMVTTGTINITQYSASVTCDTDASAALLSQTLVGAIPGLKTLQIRFGSGVSVGGVYSIIDFDDTTPTAIVLTLDRIVLEATNTTSAYQVYRCLIYPPMTDFLKFETLVDFANAITLTGPNITWKSSDLDIRDPQRTSQGLAYYLAGWGGNRTSDPLTGATVPQSTQNAGTPIYELWPHPTLGQNFVVRIKRKGEALVNAADTQLPQIPDDLIIQRALWGYAYPFAMANVGNFPTMKGANWLALIAAAKAAYKEILTEVKRNDDAQMLQSVWNRGHGLRTGSGSPSWPIDANYMQTHLLNI